MQNLHEFMRGNVPRLRFGGGATRRRFLTHGMAAAVGASGLAGLGSAGSVWAADAGAVRILAASDLKFALTRVASQYQQATGQAITLTFGSSGNMARQIQQGLPADIYMSADEDLVLQLARAGLTWGGDNGALYALGRLALLVAPGSAIPPDARLQGLRQQWALVRKFALANPEHAPYGRAAREALQSLGLWDMVQPRLVLGDNIAQATQFVTTGAAQAGITALSLVLAPELRGQGAFVSLPPELHSPLRQRMVLLAKASAAAVSFYQYLQQAAARAVLAEYGFGAPP